MHPRLIDGTAKFQDARVEFLQMLNGLAVTGNQVKTVKKNNVTSLLGTLVHDPLAPVQSKAALAISHLASSSEIVQELMEKELLAEMFACFGTSDNPTRRQRC